MDLLGEYVAQGSEDAFRQLVERHVNLVYSVASRRDCPSQEAEEITQAVFIILARKAALLPPGTVLAGWLYQTARLTAANAVRSRHRRIRREQEAHMHLSSDTPSSDDDWRTVAPLLDDAVGVLKEKDRDAVVLRFFENKSMAEVGRILGITEGAAKMRVSRALEKLRNNLARKGVGLSTTAIAATLAVHSIEAAPASVSLAAAAHASAPASTLDLVNTTLHIMSSTKIKILLGALIVLLLGSIAVTSWFVFIHLPHGHSQSPSSFAELREADIPGRYKLNDGRNEFFIVLYADHTFMNKDGTLFPMYRWELTPAAFTLTWQRSESVFTNIDAPGVYTALNPNRSVVRLEKLPPYRAAQVVPPEPVAQILFSSRCETNGLSPVNTEGADGEIASGNVAGLDCYRLIRQAGRQEAYLYLQIDPALKTPPFTNALVIVEYFDRASAVGLPGRLVIQYDDDNGVYANSEPLRMSGSQTWQEATFYLATPLFENRQNAGADFRLVVSRSELPIRSVKLVKNAPLPEMKMPVVRAR
ncbi:MAG: hypothetical protein QOF48_2046 [Verrucomicrobiota bacterium]